MAIGALDSQRMAASSGHSSGYPSGPPSDASSQRPATNSMPAAARTVTDVNASALGKKRGGVLAIALGVVGLAVIGAGIGLFVARSKGAAEQATPAKTNEPAPAPKGTLEVESTPAGASIWINGDLRAEKTPATIAGLPIAMPLDVKITMDGFEHVKREVNLAADKPGKVSVELKKGSVVVEVRGAPDNATIALDGKPTDGKRIDGVASGVSHTIVVSAAGYKDATISFTGAPQETKVVDVNMEKAPEIKHGAVKPAQVQPVAAPAGNGKLNVGASGGWCNVTVDGVARGATPVAGLELSAGSHKVTCTTADGKTHAATVTVPADGTVRHKFTL
jgi:serine/threonine-protein kinase